MIHKKVYSTSNISAIGCFKGDEAVKCLKLSKKAVFNKLNKKNGRGLKTDMSLKQNTDGRRQHFVLR